MHPPLLYRYRSLAGDAFKFTQDIFLRQRLYLAPAVAMNDLGEGLCAMHLPPNMRKNAHSKAEEWAHGNYGWGMAIRQEQAKTKIRIASFSANCTNQLLWSHYADSHRGICIGFSPLATQELSAAVPVKYATALPVWEGDDTKMLADVYTTKSADWSYEEEWRILSATTPFIGLIKDSIQTVILGARMGEDDKTWVKDWLALVGWSPQIQQAEFAKERYEMLVRPA